MYMYVNSVCVISCPSGGPRHANQQHLAGTGRLRMSASQPVALGVSWTKILIYVALFSSILSLSKFLFYVHISIYFDGLLDIWKIILHRNIAKLENGTIGWEIALPTSQRPGKETLLWRLAGQLHLGTDERPATRQLVWKMFSLFCFSHLHHATHAQLMYITYI